MQAWAGLRARAVAGVVAAAALSDAAAGRGRASAATPAKYRAQEIEKCPALATARAREQTKLGFSPDDALRALRVAPRRMHFDRETPAIAGASFFAELGLSPGTPDDEALVTFAPSGAPSTYCPGRLDWPLWIPGTLTVRLSRGQVLTDKVSMGVYTSGGRPAGGTLDGAALVGNLEVRITGQLKADSSSLGLWTGNGSEANWSEVRRANDTAGAPPGLREALRALGGRPMSCGGRAPTVDVAALAFGEAELRVAWPGAPAVTFHLPIRFAVDGAAVRGWRLAGPSSQAAAVPPSIARQAGCGREAARAWWVELEVIPDTGGGHLRGRGTLSWPGGCAARVTCAF